MTQSGGDAGVQGQRLQSSVSLACAFCCVVCVVVCLCLVTAIWLLQGQLETLSNRLLLARVLVSGRTKADVVDWLGTPDSLRGTKRFAGEGGRTVMRYRSSLRRINGSEDIWVVLDGDDRIIAVYYPDLPQERAVIRRRGTPEASGPGRE